MNHKTLTALALTLGTSLPALAETPKFTADYTACQEKSGGVTADMLGCIGAEYDVQDKQLNTAYRELMASLSGSAKLSLKSVQKDWLKYRKTTCKFVFKVAGGSMSELVSQSCILEATADRLAQLQYWKSLKSE